VKRKERRKREEKNNNVILKLEGLISVKVKSIRD
jgi:hypothetical protein